MIRKTIFASAIALGIGTGAGPAALAQDGTYVRPQPDMTVQNRQDEPRRVISLRGWDYDQLYRNGWSAEQMIDEAEVIGALGEEIGEVTNIIIGENGRARGIIASVGGFWGIGDTRVFVPWDRFRYVPADDRVYVPLTEDNVDIYETAAADMLLRGSTGRIRSVDEDFITSASLWKATDLIDDYVYFDNRNRYGYVTDLIFNADGELYAYVANPSTGYGYARGPRAFPYDTGAYYSWNPGSAYFNAPYDRSEVSNLRTFDYNRLGSDRSNLVVGGWNVNQNIGMNQPDGRLTDQDAPTGSIGRQRTAIEWTFRDVDENRDLELTSREFTRVSSYVFNRWDTDGDGVLNANELTAGLHGNLDMDRDRRVSQREFNDGWNRWGPGTAGVDFNTLDRNRDGFLTEAELGGGLNDSGYYDRWNFGNRGLARNDFNTGLYDVWDRDRSGLLDENEYDGAMDQNWF